MTDQTFRMDEPEELLDLVDANDQPIGTLRREEVLDLEANGRGFTRAIGVFFVNSKGQLCTPRRGQHKKIAPGGLDFTVGEHVGHGESYDHAALRGLQEEAGITATLDELEVVGDVPPFKGLPYFHRIYLYHTDQQPPAHKDFDGFEWHTPQDLLNALSEGEPAKEILQPSVQLVIDYIKSGVS